MKWMEFIKVQTARANVADKLLNFINECNHCHGLLEAKVFKHAALDDCSLCLLWDTDRPGPLGSNVGLQMTNIMKKYGLVDHSVWYEEADEEEEIKL